MHIATIRSQEMSRDHGEGTSAEGGFFEHEIDLPEALINLSTNPAGFILNEIAQTVAGLSQQHGLPLFLWTAFIHPKVQALTNLPAEVPFK